jgi:hypothetical protein
MLQRSPEVSCLGSQATEALSTLARAPTGEVRAGGSLQGSVRTTREKADDVAEPSSLPLQSLHTEPLSIERHVRFRAMVSGTWVPGKAGPVANDYRTGQGLSRLRSSESEHTSLLTHIHRSNLDHRGRAKTRPTMHPVQDGGCTNHGSSMDRQCILLLTPVHPTRVFPSTFS